MEGTNFWEVHGILFVIAIFIFAAVLAMVYSSYNMTFKVINNADSYSEYGERARVKPR